MSKQKDNSVINVITEFVNAVGKVIKNTSNETRMNNNKTDAGIVDLITNASKKRTR